MAAKKARSIKPAKHESSKDNLLGGDLGPGEEKVLDWILNGIIIFVLGWLALGILLSVGGLFGLWK
ncbi:MAG: hypothetical protein Q7S31_03120 [bacterium]|nr:hypothetical protein [bacterium]